MPSTDIGLTGGTGTLTIDTSGWSGAVGIDNQSTFAETISAKLALSNGQTWQASNAGGGSLTFSNTIALGSNTLTLNAANAANTITVSNAMSGAGNLAVSGSGTVLLSGTNTYTGTTTINNGATLKYSGAGTLDPTTAVTVNTGGTYNINGISDTIASIAGGGTISLGSATLTTSGNASTTFSGTIAGTGALTKAGTGTLILNNTGDSFSGLTTISAGTLQLGNGTTNGNLTGTSGVTNNATLAFNEGTATTFNKAITGSGAITVSGAGPTAFSVANSYTGATTINSGATLNLQNSSALGTGTAGATVNSGGALELQGGITVANEAVTINGTGVSGNGALRSVSGANTWNNSITLGSAASITSSTSGNLLTVGNYTTNTVTMGSNTLTVDGAGDIKFKANVGASGDTGAFIKNGSGTTTLNGDNNFYTGTTTVNAGTLVLDTLNGPVDNAILGNLVIGAGTGGADSVIVRYGTGSADNKIANTSQVTINSDGKLDLNNRYDTIGSFVLNGGHIDSGSGVVTLNGDVTTNTNAANRTALIDGHLDLGSATRTFTVANGGLASDLTVNAVINSGSVVKAGTGIMTITSDNTLGYTGTTTVSAGVLNIQDSNALGQHGSSDPTKGTTVAAGAALQLQKNLTDLTVGAETLTLNGTGINNDGALRNISGNNSWGGTVTLGSSARINTDAGSFSLSGDFIGTTQNLTVGGASNTTLSGAIGTGTGGVIKDGAGVLTLSGGTTSTFTGGLTVNDGTVVLNKTAGLNATGNGSVTIGDGIGGANTALLQLNQNEQIANTADVNIKADGKFDLNGKTETIGSLNGSGTLAIGSGTLIVANATGTSFSGAVSVDAGGTLDFTGNLASITGSLTLGAGSTLRLDLTGLNATVSVGTLHITGNTVIDFGSASASILNVTTFIIDAGVTLVSITNWGNTSDYFFAQAWTGATLDTRGAGAPETQVTFSGYLPSQTAWLSNDPWSPYNQITPAPEPATYGLILMGAGIALVGYRRHFLGTKSPA